MMDPNGFDDLLASPLAPTFLAFTKISQQQVHCKNNFKKSGQSLVAAGYCETHVNVLQKFCRETPSIK